jgi:hypothetical protein
MSEENIDTGKLEWGRVVLSIGQLNGRYQGYHGWKTTFHHCSCYRNTAGGLLFQVRLYVETGRDG